MEEKFCILREGNSIYFDNSNLEMYRESVEGVLPRKKLD